MASEICHEPDKTVHTNRIEMVLINKQTKEPTRRGHLEVNTATNQLEFNEDTGPEITKALEEEQGHQKDAAT